MFLNLNKYGQKYCWEKSINRNLQLVEKFYISANWKIARKLRGRYYSTLERKLITYESDNFIKRRLNH